MATHPFTGARKMKPTQKHRHAIWECMLGTVYAWNAEGGTKYFDYDWDGAREYAGVTAESDPRLYRSEVSYGYNGPSKGQFVLYVLKGK